MSHLLSDLSSSFPCWCLYSVPLCINLLLYNKLPQVSSLKQKQFFILEFLLSHRHGLVWSLWLYISSAAVKLWAGVRGLELLVGKLQSLTMLAPPQCCLWLHPGQETQEGASRST